MFHESITLFVFCGFICCIWSWVLPRLVSWYFKRKHKLDVEIGRIGIPYLIFHDVHISKNGVSVHVEEISIKSSFFSSEVSKLVCLVVKDVRINKDVRSVVETNVNKGFTEQSRVHFERQKIPPAILKFAQFMSIHMYSVSAMFLRPESPEWLVHVTAAEVHLDGSIIHNARTLLVNVSVTSTTTKLLKHAAVSSPQTCLGELSFGISVEATVIAQGPLSVEKLYVGVEHPKVVINEGFYGFAQRNHEGPRQEKTETSDFLERLYPLIPKNFILKIDDTKLNAMGEDNRVDFSSSLQCLQLNTQVNQSTSLQPVKQPNNLLPQVFFSFQIENFDVSCSRKRVIEMIRLSVDGNFEQPMLNISLLLDTLVMSYKHKLMNTWVVDNFLKIRAARRDLEERPSQRTWLDTLSDHCQVSGCVELFKVSVWLNLPHQPFTTSVGFNNLKLQLDQSTDVRGTANGSPIVKLFLGKQHWNMELTIECCWCGLGNSLLSTDPHMLKKYHTWSTPLFIGMVLVKARSQGQKEVKLNAMVDLFRFEWSPAFAQLVRQCLQCAFDYRVDVGSAKATRSETKPSTQAFITNVSWTNVNLFLLGEDRKVCMMLRLDKANLESVKGKIGVGCEGVKMASLKPTAMQHSCVRSDEIKSMCAHIKQARALYKASTRDLQVQFQDQVHIRWSTNVHLKLLSLKEDVMGLVREVRPLPGDVAATEEEPRPLNWAVKVKGELQCHVTLSERHHMLWTARDPTAGSTPEFVGLETALLKIAVDDADIFTMDNFQICRAHGELEVLDERNKAEGFVLEQNKIWKTTIDSFKACFPYKHSYAEAVQGEMVTVWKWLKLIHKKKKTPFTAESPLPSDMVIQLKEFLFEMSDDPFEVKLRDNYELLEDEYKESLKRQKALDVKLAELCKKHLMSMQQGKREELHANLTRRNAEIYIQRSKQMSLQGPVRTRLVAWTMSDLKILALADPSIHGAQNVVTNMTEIDPDSPWPEEGLEFTTLWCRSICASFSECKVQLRDFPQPVLDITAMTIFGRLVGAEQEATKRAKRTVTVELNDPWEPVSVERSMTSLKFYHDFNSTVERFSYAFGPCWEPVIAQCNLSFEKISPPSRDPSPPLPFWDKMRLLFHGRLTMFVNQLTMLLHASLDPYNTTEEMELTWSKVAMDWTNAKVIFHGDFNVYVRTASKYDDCELLRLPNLKLTLKLHWDCLSDPNDHHVVMPCAPDKLPEYSSNQEHDSFRAFRSQNLNLSIALETKHGGQVVPGALLYGSTLRWFENLKLILSGVTRPTCRGSVFRNLRPKRKQLSRHYRKVRVLLGFHRFQVSYWMSSAMQRGFELHTGRITFNSEHLLNLTPLEDGLRHRPQAVWSVMCMNCDLNDAEIWLKSSLQTTDTETAFQEVVAPVEKCYCLSVAKVSYGRETAVNRRAMLNSSAGGSSKDTPTHRLVVYDLKGAWTKSNRDVAFALFDSFMKSKQLKKNLSTESLKGFRGETTKAWSQKTNDSLLTSPPPTQSVLQTGVQSTPSPMSKLQSGNAATMLQQLIAEVDNKSVVFSDDLSAQTTGQHLRGRQACQEDDVVYKNWLIALVDSQVLLKGCETKGYVILSAAKAEILQRVHHPVWKDRTLVSKTTWVGSLECMQYYATVAARDNDNVDENIMWLSVDNIREKDSCNADISDLPDVPHLVGSGQSVGGVVTETVGASSIDAEKGSPIQLQRIVSRCKCEFFYAGYGDTSIDPNTLEEVPSMLIEENGPWETKERAVDAFTLMHYDLDVCTNSLQYAMILDIVNHLLLYVEPRRKVLYERLQRMRFELALRSTEDQRRPIQTLQNHVRSLVSKQRKLEKETYLLQKALLESQGPELLEEMQDLDKQMQECKEQLMMQSEELDMMLSCYKESQLSANQRLATMKGDKPIRTVRANEIVFKHAKWRLTEADGQLGIADLALSHFLYTKNSKSDDSVEHLLELGYVRMTNLLPNQVYSEVLSPTEIQANMPVDRKKAVRVFCREKAPVGGISVKEHFEINVVPITIGLTKKFYNTMVAFCFPGRDPDSIDGEGSDEVEPEVKGNKKSKSGTKKGKETNFYVNLDLKDDVEKMKERAEKNKLFIYIKIPEVPVKVSYKGNKDKNIEDIRDFSLVIPTLEYHNVTWTWLDLLLAMKNDSKKVIVSQAIKQKLQIKSYRSHNEQGASPQEEDKARMLFGTRLMPSGSEKSGKKGIFKLTK